MTDLVGVPGHVGGWTRCRDTIDFPSTKDTDISSADEDTDQTQTPTTVSEGFGAPPVVAVMVASNPGDWFEDTVESLAAVDYENFSVLVVDNAGTDDLPGRIAPVYPSAFVKRLEVDSGFSAAANEALRSVEGAAFYLFLHDDVLLEPDSITELVSEAFRANAGVVGPKLVDWDDPQVLRSVGIRVDPFGFSSPVSEPGELDQSQHDTPRPVFAVSDACMLVRADLFATLGGFDPAIPFFGEDIDLCWRAHAAGASVVFCPTALVAHRERFETRREIDNRQRLEIRHEARTMLKNYSLARLLRVTPVAFLLSLVDLLGSLLLGRFQRSGDIAGAWFWNLAHAPSLFRARAASRRSRRVPDSEYVVLMRQGSSRLQSLARGSEGEKRIQALVASGRSYLREATSKSRRGGMALLAVAVALLVYGSRGLLFGSIPSMREIPLLGRSGGHLLGEWFSGWRESGLGEPAVAPGIFPISGLLSWVLFGSVSAARRVLVIGPLFVGAIGAWKLLSRSGSTAARAAVLATYSLNPVVLNALAEGRAQTLAVYAVAPWLLRRLAHGAVLPPFVDQFDSVVQATRTPDFWRTAAGGALMVSLAASVSPLGAAALVGMLVIFAIVTAVTVDRQGGVRLLGLSLVSGVGAAVVSLPWIYASVRSGDVHSLTGLFPTGVSSASASRIITGSTGSVRSGVLGWGTVIAGTFVLVAARKWRFAWGLSSWIVALGSWTAAILVAKSGTFGGAGLELLVVPAVLGLALAVGMGALAFEEDVLGSDFGSVQILAGLAVACLVVGLAPIGVAAVDGRWHQPEGDFDSVLEPVDAGHGFRTLWIGDSDVLPVSGWPLRHSGLVIGTSAGLSPTLTTRFRTGDGEGVKAMGEAIRAAVDGQTNRLGRVLGPMGVKYVVVVDRPNPVPYSAERVPMPAQVLSSLRSQLDLIPIDVNPAMVMFKVDNVWPLRTAMNDETRSGDAVSTGSDQDSIRVQLWNETKVPPAVLGRNIGTRFGGPVPGDSLVTQAVTGDPGWKLTVDGKVAERSDWRGWGQKFEVRGAGRGDLRWKTPWSFRVLQTIQVASLLLLVGLVIGRGRQRLRIERTAPGSGDGEMLISVGPIGESDGDTVPSTAIDGEVTGG